MNYAAWILYSLFSLNDGQAYVIQGQNFKTSQECVVYAKANIRGLGTTMYSELSRQYGEGNFVPLEIGCVPKKINGSDDPAKRIPIVAMPRELYPKVEDQGIAL
jgi:hypothetical protein